MMAVEEVCAITAVIEKLGQGYGRGDFMKSLGSSRPPNRDNGVTAGAGCAADIWRQLRRPKQAPLVTSARRVNFPRTE